MSKNNNKYLAEIRQRSEENKKINERNRRISEAYFKSTPTISNIVKGLYYAYKGYLDKENESGALQGVAPTAGRGKLSLKNVRRGRVRGSKNTSNTNTNINANFSATNDNTSTVRNLETGTTSALHPKYTKATKPTPADDIRQLEGTLNPIDLGAGLFAYKNPNLIRGVAGGTLGTVGAIATAEATKAYDRGNSNNTNNNTNNNGKTAVQKQVKQNTVKPTTATTKNNVHNNEITRETTLPEIIIRPNKTKQDTTATTKQSTTAAPAATVTTKQNTPAVTKNNVPKTAKLVDKTNNSSNYKIQKGDTLYGIAKKYTGNGNDYKELLKYNNIEDENKIYVGDNLKIPDSWKRKKRDTRNERINRVKREIKFPVPDLDADYGQLLPREGGRRTLENGGGYAE